jgi:hypothetical protein
VAPIPEYSRSFLCTASGDVGIDEATAFEEATGAICRLHALSQHNARIAATAQYFITPEL